MGNSAILEEERPVQAQISGIDHRGMRGHDIFTMRARDWSALPGQARAVVLFLLGRPGSGKSTIARLLREHFNEREVLLYDDYAFLSSMAKAERRSGRARTSRARFRELLNPGQHGFEILDFSVLKLVLHRVNTSVCQHLSRSDAVILVEFARDTYLNEHVWQYFSPEVSMSARYIYCDADLDTCIERVGKRNQYITPEIMRGYYGQDGLPSLFQSRGAARVDVVNTCGTLPTTQMQVLRALNNI